MIDDVVKIFIPAILTFAVGVMTTPILTHYLYKYRFWKKKSGKRALDGGETPIFNTLHKERETSVPKLGGIIIWSAAAAVTVGLWLVAEIFPGNLSSKLDFLSRNQTWLPLFTLIFGGLIGLVDDFLEVGGGGDHIAGGLSLKKRLALVVLIGLIGAFWFYFKLEVTTIGIPFAGPAEIGWLFIPLFVIVMLGVYSGGVIDGLDGLAGGVFAVAFAAYSVVAFSRIKLICRLSRQL